MSFDPRTAFLVPVGAVAQSFSRNVVWQPWQPLSQRSGAPVAAAAAPPVLSAAPSASTFAAVFRCSARNLSGSVQIAGLAPDLPGNSAVPVPGGNSVGIFLVDWARSAAAASAEARSPLPAP